VEYTKQRRIAALLGSPRFACTGLCLILLAIPASVNAQFTFTTNNGAISITGYTCPPVETVTIPNTINGLPVTRIGGWVFNNCYALTNLVIPASVTNIDVWAIDSCTRLAAITVDALNPAYVSVDGVLFNKDQTVLLQYPTGRTGSYTIPNTVTNIGNAAFYICNFTNVVIGSGLTSLGSI
jgi:hypothetical protein